MSLARFKAPFSLKSGGYAHFLKVFDLCTRESCTCLWTSVWPICFLNPILYFKPLNFILNFFWWVGINDLRKELNKKIRKSKEKLFWTWKLLTISPPVSDSESEHLAVFSFVFRAFVLVSSRWWEYIADGPFFFSVKLCVDFVELSYKWSWQCECKAQICFRSACLGFWGLSIYD